MTFPGQEIGPGSANAEAVQWIQERLAAWRSVLPVEVDGIYGPTTEATIRLFQRDHMRAEMTGSVDAATWAALIDIAP